MTDKNKQTQEKRASGKFNQIEKRKKMLTVETKKVVGGTPPKGPCGEKGR